MEPCEHRAGEGEADCSGSVACSGVVLGRENSSPWVLGVFVETHKGAESILINFPKAIKPQNPDYCSPTSPTSQLSIRSYVAQQAPGFGVTDFNFQYCVEYKLESRTRVS